MLRFSLGETRMDRIRNENIRGTAHVRWFGHVQRRDGEYICRRMMRLELPGTRSGGRPERRCMDAVKEDMKLVKEDKETRVRWSG